MYYFSLFPYCAEAHERAVSFGTVPCLYLALNSAKIMKAIFFRGVGGRPHIECLEN